MIPRGPLIINIDSFILSNQEKKLLKNKIIGGIILFSHNHKDYNQTKNLISDIKSIDETILVCVDQEGGRIQRFIDGFKPLPSFETISANNANHTLSYDIGIMASNELSQVGVDINFSPVVDIYRDINNQNKLLKDRTFGSNVDLIISLAKEYIKGLMVNKIIPVLKHYPGHGIVDGDTHLEECKSNITLEELLYSDLKPFTTLHNVYNIPIMTSHLQFSQIDENIITYSKKWLQEIPKHIFKKQPFFISDDIEMKAAVKTGNKSDNLLSALQAGCDMVIITTMQNKHVIRSNKSYDYFEENYLTEEVIDYYENIYNNKKKHILILN